MKKSKNLNIFGRELESVDIVFENCEVYRVPASGIYRMTIDDVKFSMTLHYNGLSQNDKPGEILDFATCEDTSIILNEEGMNTRSNWDEMCDNECEGCLADRVMSNDITHFDLNFKDGTNLYVEVPWENGYTEFDNKLQTNLKKDKMILINIGEDLDKEFKDEFEDFYEIETSDDNNDNILEGFQEWLSEHNIEIFSNKEQCRDEQENQNTSFNYGVPNYIEAALSSIENELDRVMWNLYQTEYESPFRNTCNEFHCDTFDVEAYDWDEYTEQEYNFRWKDYKIRWYKYCGRGMNSNRHMSPEECAIMLDDCLQAIRSLDINDDDLIEEDCSCIQCGKNTNCQELNSGKWACQECLDNLGHEQRNLKEEIENSFFELGFEDYLDLVSLLETSLDILKYIKENTTIETLEHLIRSLEAININVKLENDLLDEETMNKIIEMAKKIANSSNLS